MEHDSKVEVIEKHYHNSDKESKGGNGLDVAALTTAVATAAGVILPAIKKAWNGDGTGHANTAMQFIPAVTSCLNAFANGGPRRYDCNCDETSILRSRIATLEAEKYSDNAAKAESDRLLVNYLKPYGQEIADSRVREAQMKGEIECLKKTQELEQKLAQKDIELARQDAKCCCEKNAMRIDSLEARMGSITKFIVPNSASCPGWGNVTITPAAATTGA